MFKRWKRRAEDRRLAPADAELLQGIRKAQAAESLPRVTWVLYLMVIFVAVALTWAALARVDEVSRADARVVPDGREQVIASLEGGILRELQVREGDPVQEGQVLALLDPTRAEAQQNEGEARRVALMGTVARLNAESRGAEPEWPAEVKAAPQVLATETEALQARRRSLQDAVASNQRSIELVLREVGVAESMAAKGLMSEVEVMRLRRQVNDLQLQSRERVNRFRQDASTELVKVKSELAALDEQKVVRDDTLRRTTLTSPVRGYVKTIRQPTLGGVVTPGAPILEIVPIGPRVLVEARIKPSDIGFVRVGQKAVVKLSAYDYTVYGSLEGKIEQISPDTLGDDQRTPSAGATYYKALVRASRSTLKTKAGKSLPVIPGMTGTLEVHTGERSVLSFLLRPMLKSQEAFRER